jgi:hypothetical protein
MSTAARASGGSPGRRLPPWLRLSETARSPGGERWLIESLVLLLVGALLATATVNDLVRQTNTNHRLVADMRTWRAYTRHDYHNLSVSQDVSGLTTREVVCGNTVPGGLKQRTQLCLVITGPVRAGRRMVSGGWYLPARSEDERRYRYGCFGPPREEGRCPR